MNVPHFLSRRRAIAWTLALAGACAPTPIRAQRRFKIAALFAGQIDDRGFMEAGYRGLVSAREKLGVDIVWRDRVIPERDLLAGALRDLAGDPVDLLIAHGGQNNEAARTIASEFPRIPFIVTQGGVTGPNLGSYEVLQEESAYLAGALAGWATKTGTVGHMSGIRVVPGLKGRAAFANGVAFANPQATLLTNFSGSQDDRALAKRVATAMIDSKADIIFTMLNAGRIGAIEACRERGAKQIGNVRDWVADVPDVFVASAIADSGIAVAKAVEDLTAGTLKTGAIEKIGLARPDAVRLSVSSAVASDQRQRLERLAERIRAGELEVGTTWNGPEFQNPS
jgi:basic membrane protein A and related proteins